MQFSDLAQRYAVIKNKIAEASYKRGSPLDAITLVAVSKKQPVEKMLSFQELLAKEGVTAVFGENYVSEFKKKHTALKPPYQAHLIGPLQQNKIRDAVALFDLIEAVHTEKIVFAVNEEAKKQGKKQEIYLQINISCDEGKAGFSAEGVKVFLRNDFSAMTNLSLKGLMAITRYYENREDVRGDFRALHALGQEIMADKGCACFLSDSSLELSMGMSQDYDIAIEEGATVVRIGTALFGER